MKNWISTLFKEIESLKNFEQGSDMFRFLQSFWLQYRMWLTGGDSVENKDLQDDDFNNSDSKLQSQEA